MFDKLISFSINNKFLILLSVVVMVVLGLFSASRIPLDAVPDITNNQVQVVTTSPTLAPQEMEQLITYPLEAAMTNIPDVVEVRSISRYGLSVITIVFEEKIPIMLARQYVQEQLNIAKGELPAGLAEPELMPITTGLGEIYQYVLTVEEGYEHLYDAIELRTIHDWIVKRQLNGTKGVIEVSSFGGYLKQYEVSLKPGNLKSFGLSISDVIETLQKNNQNSGGSYIESGPYSFYIRTEGRVGSSDEIKSILVKNKDGVPIKIEDIADVKIGSAKRYGAMTMDGKGEVVGGITLMLKGANSSEVLRNVQDRIERIRSSLPEGVGIYSYLDRSKLIKKTINTVKNNLLEGGLIVIFILLILLGNFRAGLIVASVIPLSMLFALIMMRYFGISANLMSLGAIDFGIVVDGAVIIVESLLHTFTIGYLGVKLTQNEMDEIVKTSTSKIYRSAAFGVLIILVVFIPILTLEGVEGKTFRPMAQTVGFAILGSLILSLTYVPVMASIFLSKSISNKRNFAERFMDYLKKLYQPILSFAMYLPRTTVVFAFLIFAGSLLIFSRMGAEFVPTLEEGDIAMQQTIKPGSSLNESIQTSTEAEKILLENFPEVLHVVSKIGTAEVPTDPMAIEDADIMVILKDKEEWASASDRETLMRLMKEKLSTIGWATYEFTQPIQLRFNELMTGSKSDVAVKIFGENVDEIKKYADEAAIIIQKIPGAADIKVDQTEGLQQLAVKYDRNSMAQYGINVEDVNQVIRAAYAGEYVGDIFENERKFDLVVRISSEFRQKLDLSQLTINNIDGRQTPLNEIAEISQEEGPMMISREQARRFINIGVNVRNRDVSSLVEDIRTALNSELTLPPGYEIQYGGQYENLENARNRLLIAVPIALVLILILLFMAFGSVQDTFIIFMAVPLSIIGGILALYFRGMPFSISSGIGFIALFGVSVLNGIVLLSAIKQLKQDKFTSFRELISFACLSRLRPVLMTALVAALGFLPMALSTSNGAEVQRPLATVVIGGLISSTILTLFVLPTLYYIFLKKRWVKNLSYVIMFLVFVPALNAQKIESFQDLYELAISNNPEVNNLDIAESYELINKEKVGQWEPLSLSYQGGQINYGGYDHLMNLNLNISPIFRKKSFDLRNNVIEEKAILIRNEKSLFLAKLQLDLRKLYNEHNYYASLISLSDSLVNIYMELGEKMTFQYESGELDIIDFELFNIEKKQTIQVRNELLRSLNDVEIELRRIAFLDENVSISTTQLTRSDLISLDNQGQGSQMSKLYESQDKIISKQIELEKILQNQINWNLGYFAQSLENDFIFQGVNIGLQLPIDRRVNKANLKQFEIEKSKLQYQKAKVLKNIDSEKLHIASQIRSLESTISDYEISTSSKQNLIIEKAKNQLQSGEIAYFRFHFIQDRILGQKRRYLNWLKDYNEKVFELYYLNLIN